MVRYLFFFVMMIFYGLSTYSQGFKVKEFKLNINDGSAFHAPLDSLGISCGLIKIRTDNPDLQFKGDIVGEIENKMNEYWVYVPQSSQKLKINHPNFMPLVVSFSDYGIDVSSKATYILTLDEIKYKKDKTGVTIVVKPKDSELYIDDYFIDNLNGHGLYQMYLPKGEHVCKFSKEGYRSYVQIIQTGKTSQDVSVELESLMAELEVKSKTTSAKIYVDGNLKGNGFWKGNLLAGSHMIEARQENYEPQTVEITLDEKDSKTLFIPELKRSKGKIKIVTNIPRLPLLLDGLYAGISPCEVETETGEHYVSCNAFGCLPYRNDVVVNSGTNSPININLQFDSRSVFAEYYPKAYKNDIDAMNVLASNRMAKTWVSGAENYEEAVFWRERIEKLDPAYFKSSDNNEEWLWTYELLGDEYKDKGEIDKAIHCYQKCLSFNVVFDKYTDPETKEYKERITKKIGYIDKQGNSTFNPPTKANTPQNTKQEVIDVTEQKPSFKGGEEQFRKWLAANVHYPELALENGIKGTVVASVVIERDGSIGDVTIKKGVDPLLDKETIRVIKSMPRWNPGIQDGNPVRVTMDMPLIFNLSEE